MRGNQKIIKVLKDGGIVVMLTDTIYGIVGKALDASVVKRIYKVRKRAPNKPCIILIGDINELNKFSISISEEQKKVLKKYWSFDLAQDLRPEPVSIILDCPNKKLEYLHRGTKTLAFRLPAQTGLQKLLKETGPLIAPSANLEAKPPSETISEAKKYFGDLVDLYIDEGTIKDKASKIIKLNKNSSVEVLRY